MIMFEIFKKITGNKEKPIVKSRPNEIDKMVSKRLKSRRVLLGLTQNDISKEVKVTIQQVQKYESGVNRVAAGKLFEIANFLKVPVGYFFDKGAKNEVIENEDTNTNHRQTIVLVKEFTKIENPRNRRKVIEMIKMIN